ncbi:MAG: hypothetical protein H6Q21_1405 [Bacteroidetes bacterium]|nr:hypothetical protein [Bacteroidota bacterium]
MKKVILLLLASIALCSSAQIPTAGLIVYYPFTGDAADESGNGYDGIVNGATLVADRFGNPGSAYYFNGVNNNIDVNYQICNTYESEFTISMWINADSAQELYAKLLSFPQHADSWTEYWHYLAVTYFNLENGQQKLEMPYYNDAGWVGKGITTEVYPNVWQYIVCTFDNGEVRMYVNNELKMWETFSDTQLFFPGFGFSIGSRSMNEACDGEFFKGTIDDIRIYNRKLSVSEMVTLYNEVNYGGISRILQFKFLPLPMEGFRYLKFESYYSEDDGQVNVYEIQGYNAGVNVAINKPAAANSTEFVGEPVIYANDGDPETRWSSNRDDSGPDYLSPHFVVIDLEQKLVIDSMILNIQGIDSWNQDFSMLASPDSADWYLIGSGTDTTGIFTYYTDIEKLVTVYDSVPVYDTVHVTVIDTSEVTVINEISVTDTLIIDAELTGIEPPDNINTLKIYPNPARDYIYINTGDYTRMAGYRLKVVNQLGVTVFETNVEEPLYEVDLSSWTGMGLYYIELIDTGNNIIDIRKIILQ